MAATDTDIANRALSLLGSPPISALNDGSREAVFINRIYADTRRSCLRLYPWQFAKDREQLDAPTTPPANAAAADIWTYQFAAPTGCIRLLLVDDGQTEYAYEAGLIYTNSDIIDVQFLKDVTDVALFDTLFVEVFAHWVAWAACLALTQSQQMKDKIWEDLQKIIPVARNVAATEQYPKELQTDTWVNSRDQLPLQNFVRDPMT